MQSAEQPSPQTESTSGRVLTWVRVALALVFLLAGSWKLADLEGFAEAIGKFGLLPDALVPASALLFALAEVLGALLLLVQRPLGLWLISGLLIVFMGALVYGIRLGLDIDCGCLGILESAASTSLKTALLRDIPLFMACIALLVQQRKRRRSEPKP